MIQVKRNGRYGVISDSGETLIPFQYQNVLIGEGEIVTVQEADGFWRILDLKRGIVGPDRWTDLRAFDINECCVAFAGGSAKIVDRAGQTVIDKGFANIEDCCNGIYVGYRPGEYVFFNIWGQERGRIMSEWVSYRGDLTRVGFFDVPSGKYGYRSMLDGETLEARYDEVSPFSGGWAVVIESDSSQRQFIDRSGTIVPSVRFDSAYPHNTGLIPFRVDSRYGFLSSPDRVSIEARYESVGSFRFGLCPVETDAGWRFIDQWGRDVWPETFAYAGNFNDSGLAHVQRNGGEAVVNLRGDAVWSDGTRSFGPRIKLRANE